MITRLSRLDGARLALTTLNRGESGDNAIGPQLFDGLGLIRTEELIDAGRYYGVDNQYFTTVIDYGFSKRLEEAFDKWGRDNVLRDLVRIIRMDRPWVLLSRFQGNTRDGHGNHQTAGLLTQLAFKAAGDPQQFPEQIAEGLRPWQPFKVYMGGVRDNEDWTVRIDSGEYSPWLGDSYDNVARYGLSFQRSQNSGRFTPSVGPNFGYYKRVGERLTLPAKEASLWEGLDTTYAGLFKTLGPNGVRRTSTMQLAAIDRAVGASDARLHDDRSVQGHAGTGRGLDVRCGRSSPRARKSPMCCTCCRIKERQFQAAINAALGLEFTALAQPAECGGANRSSAPRLRPRRRWPRRYRASASRYAPGSRIAAVAPSRHWPPGSASRPNPAGASAPCRPALLPVGELSRHQVMSRPIRGHRRGRCAVEHAAVLFSNRFGREPLHAERFGAVRPSRWTGAAGRRGAIHD